MISFAALHFVDPARNRYRYRLDGYDEDWNTSGPEPAATYTSLDPGRYTFRVQASNSDGVWNEDGASLAIVILPPWWGTWWFKHALRRRPIRLPGAAHNLTFASA